MAVDRSDPIAIGDVPQDRRDLGGPVAGWADQLADRLRVQDEQLRALIPDDAVTEAMQRPGLRLSQVVGEVMTGYADRPATGTRATELVTDPASGRATRRLLDRFETSTYRELWGRVRAVAAAWRHDDDIAAPRPGDFVATLGFTSADYVVVDLACVHEGLVAVPLQAGSSAARLRPILDEVEARVLATSTAQLDVAIESVLGSAVVRHVIVFDHHADDDDHRDAVRAAREKLHAAGNTAVVETLAELVARGSALPRAEPHVPDAEDPLVALLYTSGSTGTPKGAMYPESLVRGRWLKFRPGVAGLGAVRISYLPLSHLAGRTQLVETFSAGGTSYFTASPDLSELLRDISLVRPVELFLIPRVCDMLRQYHQKEMARRGAENPAEIDTEVKKDIRTSVLGGRVVRAAFSSAPLAATTREFVSSCLGVELHDGYGSTETGPLVVDGQVVRSVVEDYRLADVPELGYLTTDTPHPRGELLVKSRMLIPGYYRRPDLTARLTDEEGFYRTGDIMAEVGPDRLQYLDRASTVLKLSQGEFVALTRLELLFATSPLVDQIFLYGNSERAYLLAVAVPSGAVSDKDDEASHALLSSFRSIGREYGLNSYEVPHAVLVEREPFSVENGLLSEMRKPLRPRMLNRYRDVLEALYDLLAAEEVSELTALRAAGRDQPVFPALRRAVSALLGCPVASVTPETRYRDLGGDSLSALTFATLLRDVFEVPVPVSMVINPAADLGTLAEHIETAKTAPATAHRAPASSVTVEDLRLAEFLDTHALQAALLAPGPGGDPRTVLLTGANGYLGRFLCLEQLGRLPEVGGKLICLVRGGAPRLAAAYDGGDEDLPALFAGLASRRLEVLDGDLGARRLGLPDQTWHRLATEVDLVLHAGALVNHLLPYDELHDTNVAGTATVIELALTTKRKSIAFVSTITALDGGRTGEQDDIRRTHPARELNSSYANGYGASKWAAEVLLRHAHEEYDLPVAVFRSDLILAHPRYAGQLNLSDVFTRLLRSVLTTGLAPASFYRPAPDGSPQSAHFAGLPVDFVAKAISTLSTRVSGYETYHVMNPHDNGISLDTFVDWLIDAGHQVTRVEDYTEWVTRFGAALRGLPEAHQRQSLLPLLHAFDSPTETHAAPRLPTTRFTAALRQAGLSAPHLTQDLITKYVHDFARIEQAPQ
ncbi:carboxylic acid reductase [Lentzea sp. NPDC004782]|uniref:carboxylic acid reductase n=1 Tax=Lentzea sp. NPDC004782 TaxID=3154458 RepID=UPI0033BB00B3